MTRDELPIHRIARDWVERREARRTDRASEKPPPKWLAPLAVAVPVGYLVLFYSTRG